LLTPEAGEETALRRLTILLAMKSAYIKAIGQPLGFDWSRLEFDVPARQARGDGLPLQGWEFRVFNAHVGVLRDGRLCEEAYVCCVAFFRGSRESKFDFHEGMEQLESWVQFINIDQMLKVVPKLTA
jgi:4'-phosphopantetheinyl transferase